MSATCSVSRLALAGALLAGCFDRPSEQYACATTQDCDDGRTCQRNFCVVGGSEDGGTQDADTVCPTFMSRHFDACMIPAPMGPMMLTAGEYRYDTTTGMMLDPSSNETSPPSAVVNERRVLSVGSFTLAAGGTLRVVGMHPLVIASWDTLAVQGTLDVASAGMLIGAGSNPAACVNHRATPGTLGAQGGAGGGGGSLQSAGGTGGLGSEGASNVTGGPGGIALGAANVPLLEGGCPGESGGLGGGGALAGAGGPGGGAVQLTALTSVTIGATGRLSAGGGGGGTGAVSNVGGGGGGGGAGGMIGLEAPMVVFEAGAILAANGGGGGQGGGAAAGQPGQNAQVGAAPAPGGTGGSGGPGGAGSVSVTAGGNGTADGAGGGGGGGGAGYIAIKSAAYQPDVGAVISPAATIIP